MYKKSKEKAGSNGVPSKKIYWEIPGTFREHFAFSARISVVRFLIFIFLFFLKKIFSLSENFFIFFR